MNSRGKTERLWHCYACGHEMTHSIRVQPAADCVISCPSCGEDKMTVQTARATEPPTAAIIDLFEALKSSLRRK
jgi:transcription elongation factor Elf1